MDDVLREMASEMKVEKLHADTIDRIERYINQYHGGECDVRTLVRIVIKQLAAEQETRSKSQIVTLTNNNNSDSDLG